MSDAATLAHPALPRARALPEPSVPSRAFRLGRLLLGACFVLDAGWYVASYDVRSAYLHAAGSPVALVWLTVAVYLAGGVALARGVRTREAAVALGAMLAVGTAALYPAIRAGGIGEFPPDLWHEVGFKEVVVHVAIIGALLLASAPAPDADAAPLPDAAHTAGRLLVGAYFVVNALWQWWYFDIRVEHIVASGRNPAALPVIIGLQLVAGTLVAAGLVRRVATAPLMLIIVVSTIVVHGNLSATAPYPPNVQVHQWFVKAAILAGLIMVAGTPRRRAAPAA